MAKVELKGIGKVYDGAVRAVDNANIVVDDQEFVVFVGPSGCGKSTTLRMVAGLEEISEGDLFIDGERMNDVPPKDRNIAMVFQNYALYTPAPWPGWRIGSANSGPKAWESAMISRATPLMPAAPRSAPWEPPISIPNCSFTWKGLPTS